MPSSDLAAARPTGSRLRRAPRTVASLALALAASVASLGLTSSAATASPVSFLLGEQLQTVERPGTTSQEAMAQLLAGPTAQERAQGFRSYLPASTELRSVSVADGVATVNLSLGFVNDDAPPQELRARLSQVVSTLTGPEGSRGVRVLVEGGVALGLFPGVSMTATLTPAYLATPTVPAPQATQPPKTTATVRAATSTTKGAQQRLADIGFLLPSEVDGRFGPVTQAAVIAFQKWERLPRTGQLNGPTRSRLSRAKRPTAETSGGVGKRAEVFIDRQIALAIQDDRVVRVIHVSTGKPSTPTPTGDFKVYGQFAKWWSTPFQEWLLWASPFNGGIAFHQFPEVPVYAASHGCVRITAAQAKWMFEFLDVSTPVKVMAKS